MKRRGSYSTAILHETTPAISALVLGAISASGINTHPSVVAAQRWSDTHWPIAAARTVNHHIVRLVRGSEFFGKRIAIGFALTGPVAHANASEIVLSTVFIWVRSCHPG
jgi:hypothetical protein